MISLKAAVLDPVLVKIAATSLQFSWWYYLAGLLDPQWQNLPRGLFFLAVQNMNLKACADVSHIAA